MLNIVTNTEQVVGSSLCLSKVLNFASLQSPCRSPRCIPQPETQHSPDSSLNLLSGKGYNTHRGRAAESWVETDYHDVYFRDSKNYCLLDGMQSCALIRNHC